MREPDEDETETPVTVGVMVVVLDDPPLQEGDIVTVPQSFFYINDFQDVVSTILSAVGIYSLIYTLTR